MRALYACGLTAERYAKDACPVDTGRLRNSITFDLADDGDQVVVGTNVEYAPHVELGTRRQKAQPYLTPAVANHTGDYLKLFQMQGLKAK